MNVAARAKAAYSDAKAPIRTARGTEYRVFAQVTHKLSQAHNADFESFHNLVVAIHENRKLWNTLAVDVAHPDNALPKELRAQIFYLAEFTEAHSQKVLARSEDASILVEINTAVMRGLRTSEGSA